MIYIKHFFYEDKPPYPKLHNDFEDIIKELVRSADCILK